jgi:2-amino-4-hydroxy-6-hydroxymethyldihydropteridine diphosphokinase
MILLGLGANLPSSAGPPRATIAAALPALQAAGVTALRRSGDYSSPAWPAGQGPDYVNAVAQVDTKLGPAALLKVLHHIEAAFGRKRRTQWEARPLDLDILDYWGLITDTESPALPHPWLAERPFVLWPLLEVAPAWTHPISGLGARALLDALPPAVRESCKRIDASRG